jgi:hypothetical protein
MPETMILSGPPSPLYIAPVCSPLPPPLPLLPLFDTVQVLIEAITAAGTIVTTPYTVIPPQVPIDRGHSFMYCTQIKYTKLIFIKFVGIRQRIHNLLRHSSIYVSSR